MKFVNTYGQSVSQENAEAETMSQVMIYIFVWLKLLHCILKQSGGSCWFHGMLP